MGTFTDEEKVLGECDKARKELRKMLEYHGIPTCEALGTLNAIMAKAQAKGKWPLFQRANS